MAGTVTIACKIPNGLILRLHEMIEEHEPVLGGGSRPVRKARQVGGPVQVKGPNIPVGELPEFAIAGGYALTSGVDADFWATWKQQNAQHDAVLNNLIFAHEKPDIVTGQAKEKAALRSGLERLDPSTLPRGSKVETATAKP